MQTVLIANRGEIARRIIRTLRRMGIRSVAVYSDGDRNAAHVREADTAVNIGPDPASESYLNIAAIIRAAQDTGATAIHPGYGFLAESVRLAEACAIAGITFIGPGTHALDVMGDKIRAREHLAGTGVPQVPGFAAAGLTDEEISGRAREIGFPLLVKPSAGGGGKGMEIVRAEADLPAALEQARRIATASFGDDTLLIERLIERPRHIEVQVFGSANGIILTLGERECTLQRRHQKVIEESPNAGGISPQTIAALELAAVQAAASVEYVGAGTVEFLVNADNPDEFFFIEMNTRLQVEHPVTEEVLGLDLVELQIRTAAGENIVPIVHAEQELVAVVDTAVGSRVGWSVTPQGHAVEARVYAESPERGFLPSVGEVLLWRPSADARVDSVIEHGDEVSPAYDPMIAKIITHASTREEALAQLDRALAETAILGVETNLRFLRTLITHERVQRGDLDTGLIETLLPFDTIDPPADVLWEASQWFDRPEPNPEWASPLWRTPETRSITVLVDDDGTEYEATIPSAGISYVPLPVDYEEIMLARDPDGAGHAVWASKGGSSWRFTHLTRRERTLRDVRAVAGPSGNADSTATSPMPGTVAKIHAETGTTVEAGDPLVSVEAMKMEHPVTAPHPGVVRILVEPGEQVRRGQEVAVVNPEGAP